MNTMLGPGYAIFELSRNFIRRLVRLVVDLSNVNLRFKTGEERSYDSMMVHRYLLVPAVLFATMKWISGTVG